MEKNPEQARKLLIWIQKAIPAKFSLLIRDKDGNVNVHSINNFLAIYGISLSYLRKIRSNHAIDIYGNENDSKRKHICQLALRHKVIIIASDHYGVMNNRRNIPITKEKNAEILDIIDLYNY